MSPPYTGRSFAPGEKGQTAVLGLVLLIGMVAIVSVGMLVVAGDTITSTEQETENERVEQAFVELSQQMTTAANDGDTSRSIDLDVGEKGTVVRTGSGSIKINGEGIENAINININSLEYQGNDGTKIAYQAGAVFNGIGDETRVISEPSIDYNKEGDTLNFPFVEISDESQVNSGNINLKRDEPESYDIPPLEDSTVKIEVTSRYCIGWETYFKEETQEAGGQVIHEGCNEGSQDTVIAEFGRLDIDYSIEDGAVVFDDDYIDDHCTGNNDCVIGDEHDDDQPPVLDDKIDELIADATHSDSDFDDISDNGPNYDDLDGGFYYIEEIAEDDSFNFDLYGEEAVLVVEGDINLGEEIMVEGDGDLKIYTGGDRFAIDGNVYHENMDGDGAKHIQLFGKSKLFIDMGPGAGGYYEGLIYAASDQEQEQEWDNPGSCSDNPRPQAHIQAGQVDFDGSITVYSICAQSQGHSDFRFNEDLDGVKINLLPTGYELAPDVYYVNTTKFEVHTDG